MCRLCCCSGASCVLCGVVVWCVVPVCVVCCVMVVLCVVVVVFGVCWFDLV